MKTALMHKWVGKFSMVLAVAGSCTVVAPRQAQAQIPVTDAASISQQIIDYANQGLQYAKQIEQYKQMLQDYMLQLQNLQQLPGAIRQQIETQLIGQLVNTVGDFGVAYLNNLPKLSPEMSSFYANAETVLKNSYGQTPGTLPALNATLASLGLTGSMSSPTFKSNYTDRMRYERLLDDIRQVALTRNNAEKRATEARGIAAQMKTLPDNNTVGAIQLLAAQNSLSYGQMEDLIKSQSQTLKVIQQQESQQLANQENLRQLELARVKNAQSRTYVTGATEERP